MPRKKDEEKTYTTTSGGKRYLSSRAADKNRDQKSSQIKFRLPSGANKVLNHYVKSEKCEYDSLGDLLTSFLSKEVGIELTDPAAIEEYLKENEIDN